MTTGTPFDPPLVAASLSGRSDAAWAREASPFVGAAFLGGIALDAASRAAARDLVARDREEFLPPDPIAFIDAQLASLDGVDVYPGVNLRSATVEPIREAAAVCAGYDAVAEVNAHCRQPELCAVGCGESLLREPTRLADYVTAAAETGATVSVKLRAEVPGVDLAAVAETAVEAGASIVHVDAMDTESVVAEVAAAVAGADVARAGVDRTGVAGSEGVRTDPVVIANNGVRDRESVREYLEYGADAVSVGRPSDDPRVLGRVAEAVADRTERTGTEVSP